MKAWVPCLRAFVCYLQLQQINFLIPCEKDYWRVVDDGFCGGDGHVDQRWLPHLFFQLLGPLPAGILQQHFGSVNKNLGEVEVVVLKKNVTHSIKCWNFHIVFYKWILVNSFRKNKSKEKPLINTEQVQNLTSYIFSGDFLIIVLTVRHIGQFLTNP